MSEAFLWLAYTLLSGVALLAAVVTGFQGDTPATIALIGAMWFFSNRSNSVEGIIDE